MQEKCLRSIIGAYKATNTRVLEAEAGVMALDAYLDQTVLQSRMHGLKAQWKKFGASHQR